MSVEELMYDHIKRVGKNLDKFKAVLKERKKVHDASKLEPPEKEIFEKYTPLLRETTYGSEKYKKYLSEMKTAIDHHYKNNRHHPEHNENGMAGMTLFDLIEMFCDWEAATHRHEDGNIYESIKHNKSRFGYSEMMAEIMRNTADEMGRLESRYR